MDRFAIFVDSGYFLKQSLDVLGAPKLSKRETLHITSPDLMLACIEKKARDVLSIPDRELLRIYWYDGVFATGMTPQQKSITSLGDVLFRAGTINSKGQQKGVDSLIVTDLIELASNHAICDAAVMTGDADLAVGIEIAQKKGIRVAVLGVDDPPRVAHSQSPEITSRADRIGRLVGSDLRPFMQYVPPPLTATPTPSAPIPITAVAPASPRTAPASSAPSTPIPPMFKPTSPVTAAHPTTTEDPRIIGLVKGFISTQKNPETAVNPATKAIEASVDRGLLYAVYTGLGRRLEDPEKIRIRQLFRKELGFE